MTVGTTTNVAKHVTDGIVTTFPHSFIVFEQSHLRVMLRNADGSINKTYAQNEFSVAGLGANAGSVTIVPAPAANKELLVIREVPLTQGTDIVNQGGFFPEVIEKQLDLIVMQAQQLKEQLNRAVVSAIGDSAYTFSAIEDGEFVKRDGTELVGASLAEISADAEAAATEAQSYTAALLTYTFGYIGIDDDTPPDGVDDGEGYVYTMNGRLYGALNDGGVPDVKFELLTKALADEGGPGNGTVSSIAASGGTTGFSFTGGPVTTTGTLTLTGTLVVANGGTGATTAAGARANLSAAASGANEDITSLRQSTTIAATGVAAADSIGYRGLPASAQAVGSTITLGLADAGKLVPNTTGGWTIPANSSVAFPVGTVVVVYNNSGSTQSVSITTDTLRWAGSSSTGSRTVAQRGFASLVKVAATEWVAQGNIT